MLVSHCDDKRDDSPGTPASSHCPKNMYVRLIGDSKLSLGVSVNVCGCLSRLSLCGPVMDWRPVQGVPRLSPDDRWERLQPPCDPTDGLHGIENGWMDGIGLSQHSLLYPYTYCVDTTMACWNEEKSRGGTTYAMVRCGDFR